MKAAPTRQETRNPTTSPIPPPTGWAERIVKSFAFSVALFLLWGGLTLPKAWTHFSGFDRLESFWVVYNGTIAILFLVRSRPSVVSLHPLHWLVALLTSFSGLFFRRAAGEPGPLQAGLADAWILSGLALGTAAAAMLGRSYDFVPALRGVQTGWLYVVVRHPMYLSSILIRLGYLVRHSTVDNLIVFAVMVWLYDLRARYEEQIMQSSERYRDYLARVRFRFIPFLY